ncbi:tyrosine-type recombinase/integrase [Burkholderia stagnalis]
MLPRSGQVIHKARADDGGGREVNRSWFVGDRRVWRYASRADSTGFLLQASAASASDTYLRAALKHARKIGKIEYGQTANMGIPTQSDERPVYKGRREMLETAKACSHRKIRTAVRTAFYSGMRMNEIPRAAPAKAEFSLGTTRNERPRSIPIHPRIAAITRRVEFTEPAWKIKDEWAKARRKSNHRRVVSRPPSRRRVGNDQRRIAPLRGRWSAGAQTTTSIRRYARPVTDRLAKAVKNIGRS